MSDRNKAFKFGSEDESREQPEPFPLEINGETVMCVGEVDGLRLLEYTAQMRRDAEIGVKAAAVTEWLEDCILDYQAFRKICARHKLDIEDLVDIARYLAETYSARPTSSAESSSTGQTTTGSSSAAGSSSVG